MRQYGSKQVTKTHNRAALAQLLLMRASLDGIDPAGLARSYGVPVPDIDRMVAEEKQRRERRA